MEKRRCSASVRMVVEFGMRGGDLLPGAQLSRMREGMLGHQARQKAMPDARAEVVVRGEAEGALALLEISGRIDVLYTRGVTPVVEEIKLVPADAVPTEALPAHWAQAVCYGHMLDVDEAVVRVVYVHRDGAEVVSFEEQMNRARLSAAFFAYITPYLHMLDERLRWMDARDASIRALAFPFGGYRTGQREMAVQAYWAVRSRRRLFAQAPTGTGKTAATLFPALKALGEGLTGQLFYLTARTTAQQNAARALNHMRAGGLRLRALQLTAKEKICPFAAREEGVDWRCDVLACPLAIGFYDRLSDALEEMRGLDDWTREAVERVAAAHTICPFELGMSLCEEADAVLCDYNYAFDPAARIRRVFTWKTDLTLLVDEAHNLPERARDMLSAALESRALREIRRNCGKTLGRKAPLYGLLTKLVALLEAQPEGTAKTAPEGLAALLDGCMEAALAVAREVFLGDLTRILLGALGSLERYGDCYATLVAPDGRYTRLTLYCLDPAPHLREATRKLRGCVFFSATLTPLAAWREAIGGTEEDALLSLPSPFPQKNLLVLRSAVPTTYRAREGSAGEVAACIVALVSARPGNYLACFSSYAYLRLVQQQIEALAPEVALRPQQGGMDDAARAAYLEAFVPRKTGALLGLVVLGGIFGEGVDLPGERLSGVAVVGVGLPQICPERELLRAYYDEGQRDGFAQAYRYPGMNKVLQAVGRVIRTETDRGVALLIDERFMQPSYASLLPPWWFPAEAVQGADDIRARIGFFWER